MYLFSEVYSDKVCCSNSGLKPDWSVHTFRKFTLNLLFAEKLVSALDGDVLWVS